MAIPNNRAQVRRMRILLPCSAAAVALTAASALSQESHHGLHNESRPGETDADNPRRNPAI